MVDGAAREPLTGSGGSVPVCPSPVRRLPRSKLNMARPKQMRPDRGHHQMHAWIPPAHDTLLARPPLPSHMQPHDSNPTVDRQRRSAAAPPSTHPGAGDSKVQPDPNPKSEGCLFWIRRWIPAKIKPKTRNSDCGIFSPMGPRLPISEHCSSTHQISPSSLPRAP